MVKNNIGISHGKISLSEESEKELTPFKDEEISLKRDVEENTKFVNKLSSVAPKQISTEHYKKTLVNIDFSNKDVNNLVKKIPEHRWSLLLYKAASLKNKYWGELNDVEALQYSMKGRKESDLFLESCKGEDNLDNYNLLDAIYKAIDEWKDPLNWVFIPANIIFFNDSIDKSIDNNRVLHFDRLPPDTQKVILSWIERKYRDILEESIINFLVKNPDTSIASLLDDEEILKLYIKLYNVQLYGTTPISYESLSEQKKLILQKYFKAELLKLWLKVNGVDLDILKELEERDKRIREENQKRLQKFKKRNKELNGKLKSNSISTEEMRVDWVKTMNIDIQTAPWVDIAESTWLWKQLTKQYNNKNIIEESQINEDDFSIARQRFIESHMELQEYLTIKSAHQLYNNNNNSIKNLDDEAWNWLKKIFRNQPDELKKIYNQLLSFPNEINKTKEELYNNSKFFKSIEYEDKNNQAIGTVIDNVRNIFSEHSKSIKWNLSNRWFKFNEKNPVKIEWDNLVIFWEFNWANIMLRYNLKSWELFMNSFLQYNGNSKITLWNDSVANYKVWQLLSFDNILSSNESLNSQMNLLSDVVINSSKKQSAINSIVLKFMKTLNVITDTQKIINIEVNDWSNFFDFLQIIENSDSTDLEKFQIFMEKIMKRSWLERGQNNLFGAKLNLEQSDNKYINLLKDNAEKFSDNPSVFKGKTNFESDSQLSFIHIIIDNITNGVSKPNWKLDSGKINDFIGHLETDGKNR